MARNVEDIPLRPVVPRADTLHRPFIVAALSLAVLVGFLLGAHVPLSRLLDGGSSQRTADLVQAHGQVQLLGFAGLYVIGMGLRLLPRFVGSRLQLEGLAPVALWSMVVALAIRAVVMPWTSGDLHDALLLGSLLGVLVATATFLVLIAATIATEARRIDAAAIAFLLGATVLFAISAVSLLAGIDAVAGDRRTLPYLANTAVVQAQLLGFILVFIAGVGLRALPVLTGRERPEAAAAVLPPVIIVCVSVHATALLLLEYASSSDALSMLADASLFVLGVALLGLVLKAGVLTPRANRARPASQPAMWLVRTAFFWLAVAAALMVYFGASAFLDERLVLQHQFDAMRHALGAGLITSLILGMSMLILPEFAVERQHANRQRQLAIALALLVNAAVVLRVGPALAATDLTLDERDLSMAIAGTIGEIALLIFAVYLFRLIWRTRTT